MCVGVSTLVKRLSMAEVTAGRNAILWPGGGSALESSAQEA